MIRVAPFVSLPRSENCRDCGSWPCRCPIGPQTECVCGGRLSARDRTEAAIRDAVITHQGTWRHREWREARGL